MENNQLLANVQDTDEKNNFFIGQCCFITQAGVGGKSFSTMQIHMYRHSSKGALK